MAVEFGELRVLRKLNDYEFGVTIRVMRSGLNRNKWDYQNLDKYYQSFSGTPILCAFPNGRIGDGHEMEEKRDANGEEYYSFIGPNSERIVGTISEDPKDLKLVEEDGETWLVAEGRLFAFYAKELVDNIVQKKVMEVSAETEVFEATEEPDREVFTKWAGLGVTILGEGVAPAIPGANIKALQAMESEFKELKLRAASYRGNESTEEEHEEKEGAELANNETQKPQKNTKESEETTLNLFSKKQIAELSQKFDGYTVLSAGQDENGIHVCLMSAKGDTATYTMNSLEDTIVPENFIANNAKVVFKADEWEQEVDSCDITDSLSAALIKANSDLDSTKADLDKANSTIETMKNAEMKRRVSACKAKAVETLNSFNANRSEKVSNSILTKINESIDNGNFSDCVNGEGEWCGEEEVMNKVLAACAAEVMEYDKRQAQKNNTEFIWEGLNNKQKNSAGGVAELLSTFGIN